MGIKAAGIFGIVVLLVSGCLFGHNVSLSQDEKEQPAIVAFNLASAPIPIAAAPATKGKAKQKDKSKDFWETTFFDIFSLLVNATIGTFIVFYFTRLGNKDSRLLEMKVRTIEKFEDNFENYQIELLEFMRKVVSTKWQKLLFTHKNVKSNFQGLKQLGAFSDEETNSVESGLHKIRNLVFGERFKKKDASFNELETEEIELCMASISVSCLKARLKLIENS